jgi:hypothetical protein
MIPFIANNGHFLLRGRIPFGSTSAKRCVSAAISAPGMAKAAAHEKVYGQSRCSPWKYYLGKFCVNFCSLGSLPAGRVPFETIRAIAVLP